MFAVTGAAAWLKDQLDATVAAEAVGAEMPNVQEERHLLSWRQLATDASVSGTFSMRSFSTPQVVCVRCKKHQGGCGGVQAASRMMYRTSEAASLQILSPTDYTDGILSCQNLPRSSLGQKL